MTNTQIIQKPSLYISGLNLRYQNATQVLITEGEARDSSNKGDIRLDDSILLDTSVKGVNGLDEGTLATNTFYTIFVISDSTLENSSETLMSITTNTPPMLPAGYDIYRKIGWIKIGAVSEIVGFDQVGGSNTRHYSWRSKPTILNAGNATVFADLSTVGWVPPLTASELGKVDLNVGLTPSLPGSSLFLRPSLDTTPAGFGMEFAAPVVGVRSTGFSIEVNVFPVGLEYQVTGPGDSAFVWLLGYEFQV